MVITGRSFKITRRNDFLTPISGLRPKRGIVTQISLPPGISSLRLKRTVAFVGMMGSGKTAVGRAVAEMLAVPFLDSDHEIELAANATITEIFERDGERFFRDREAEVIARLLTGAPCILSTGGGAYLQERNRQTISAHGQAVWLKADLSVLWARVRNKDTRPLLRTADPYATLSALYAERVPVYAQADLVVETRASYSIADTALRVIEILRQTPGLLEEKT